MNTSYNYSTQLDSTHKAGLSVISAFINGISLGSSVNKVLCSTLPYGPIIKVTCNRVILQLFYYSNTQPLSSVSINALANLLSGLYPGHTLELRFTRLQQPYLNSSILAQYIAINASKYGFNRLENTLFNAVPFLNSNVELPSYITGVKIQVSGLLTTQSTGPGKTVYSASNGTFIGNVDYSMYTSKSAIGSYTVKVWISTSCTGVSA